MRPISDSQARARHRWPISPREHGCERRVSAPRPSGSTKIQHRPWHRHVGRLIVIHSAVHRAIPVPAPTHQRKHRGPTRDTAVTTLQSRPSRRCSRDAAVATLQSRPWRLPSLPSAPRRLQKPPHSERLHLTGHLVWIDHVLDSLALIEVLVAHRRVVEADHLGVHRLGDVNLFVQNRIH